MGIARGVDEPPVATPWRDEVDRSPRPGEAAAAIDRLLDRHPSLGHHLTTDAALRAALIAVVGTSRTLTRLIDQRPGALAVLQDLDARPDVPTGGERTGDDLVDWHRLELLRLAARDLTGRDDLGATARGLADAAADVLCVACEMVGATDLAVIGMGKVGGRELNYASDVDVMFVGDGDRDAYLRHALQVVELAGRCFRVDTNLRPEGRDGPLARTLDSFETYWDRWAQPWELQALLKARPVAGNASLGQRFLDTAQRWLWAHPIDVEALRSIRAMKARSEAAAEGQRAAGTSELKQTPGGIRDIEFTAQLLQLVHGHLDPELRSPTTLDVLAELGRAGYIDRADATDLADAYRLLRTVEHRLQMIEGQPVHTLPADRHERAAIARSMGRRDGPDGSADAQLDAELRSHRHRVRAIQQRVYFRPLLETFVASSALDGKLTPTAAAARLTAFGFTDTSRTQSAIRELTKGLNRTSRLMQQLLPLLLDWLSEAPDPDLGLLLLRNLWSASERRATLASAFRDSPDAARCTCTLLGTSRLLADIVLHNPDLAASLPAWPSPGATPRTLLVETATKVTSWRGTAADKREGLRRWKDRQLLGIAARDIFGAADIAETGRDVALLAETCLDAALAELAPSFPFAVVGLGRFGGAELSYASDLDVVFVYEGEGSVREEASRLAGALLRFLGGDTPVQTLWKLDLDLRPEGRKGALVRRIDGYVQYWEHYAEPWERMAMTRARVVAGDRALGDGLIAALRPFVWEAPVTDEVRREIRRLKARMENERIPTHEDPQFHLKLGRGSMSDIEFTVQLLQLEHGVETPTTLDALARLTSAGVVPDEEADRLAESFRFCEITRNRWYLVNSGPGDALPTQPEPLLWLARSLGTTPSRLREDYRRVTRRARRVVERRFYGSV